MDSYVSRCAALARLHLIFTGLLLFCNTGMATESAGSHQRALIILATQVQVETQEHVAIYGLNTPVSGGQIISSWNRKFQVPIRLHRAWFYFVDDMPGANWEHPCRYIFIDYDSDDLEVLKGSTPPDNLNDMVRITLP